MALSPKIKQFAAIAMMGAAMGGDTSHNLSMDHVRNDHLPQNRNSQRSNPRPESDQKPLQRLEKRIDVD